ncbi:MAG: ABC transporter permease [Candidatus Babeliales bacterium]|nr:ABC transporter permease [Candidatus Babeliales bacterium]
MNITSILAFKYLFSVKNENSISTTIKICASGILIGTFSLALVMSIMNGFEHVTIEKMQALYPQVIMEKNNTSLDMKKISKVIKNEFPEVECFAPNNIQYVILQINGDNDINNVVILKGIYPKQESKINKIQDKIISPFHNNLETLLQKNLVIIGEKIAKNFNIKLNDKVNLLFPDKVNSNQIIFDKKEMVVSGIFKTGLDEFDSKLIFTSLDFLKKQFNYTATQIGIKLKQNCNEQCIIEKLKTRFKFDVYSWQSLQPSLLSALKLEKYVMYFIILLITFVASTNIISLIFMLIIQKQRDIAILKAMGTKNITLQIIFLKIGLIISLFSTFAGLLLAYLFGKFLEIYPFIELPDVYYVTTLPIKMNFSIFSSVFISVMIICIIAILIPLKKIKTLNICDVLKYE